jgi:acyl carrier protein
VSNAVTLDRNAIEGIILNAIRSANLSRPANSQLDVSPSATIFGADSPLDSLGLVALLIDVEEALSDRGAAITLTDARAMSQTRSPFRAVQPLVDYIVELLSGSPEQAG